MNKQADNDWFLIEPANKQGTRWKGKCWYVHNMVKYEFEMNFEVRCVLPRLAWSFPESLPAPADPCDVPDYSFRNRAARARRQNGQDVSVREPPARLDQL